MKNALIAALALTAATSLYAQAPNSDLSYVAPVLGSWKYAETATGSEAIFSTRVGPQLTIRCTRAMRRISFLKPASAASSSLSVWTSSEVKNVAATFDAANARVSADLSAFDPLLDAMALSRGRIGFTIAGAPTLVVPAWAEVGRVIEDCRV